MVDIPHGEVDESVDTVKRLASSPSTQITTWQGYDINGYRFHTKEKDKKSATQNSGVRYEGIDESTGKSRKYYGVIQDIWELEYSDKLQITAFRCQWVKLTGVFVDECGLTTVELQSVGYKDDQWVLASKVAQLAYYVMPEDNRKYVVMSGKQRIVGTDGVQSPKEYNNYAEPRLFIDHPRKIKTVEDRFNKSKMMPWAHPDGEKRTVIGSLPSK
jgi:hypothetical protein